MNERIAWTWRHAIAKTDLAPTTKHVLLTISLYMNELGKGCYPTQEELSKATSLSDRAIRTHLEIAEKAGWIVRKEHGFKGQKWRNHEYEACWPDVLDVDLDALDVDEGAEGGSSRSAKGAERGSGKVRKEVPTILPITNSTPLTPRSSSGRRVAGEEGVSVNKLEQPQLWNKLVELRGKPPPTDGISWYFPSDMIEKANKELSETAA